MRRIKKAHHGYDGTLMAAVVNPYVSPLTRTSTGTDSILKVHAEPGLHSCPTSLSWFVSVQLALLCILAMKSTQSNRRALVLPGGQKEAQGKKKTTTQTKHVGYYQSSGLKHVQDGVVHLDQHRQVDRQAWLAILCGGRARQPWQGVVLLQYKPAHVKYAVLSMQRTL